MNSLSKTHSLIAATPPPPRLPPISPCLPSGPLCCPFPPSSLLPSFAFLFSYFFYFILFPSYSFFFFLQLLPFSSISPHISCSFPIPFLVPSPTLLFRSLTVPFLSFLSHSRSFLPFPFPSVCSFPLFLPHFFSLVLYLTPFYSLLIFLVFSLPFPLLVPSDFAYSWYFSLPLLLPIPFHPLLFHLPPPHTRHPFLILHTLLLPVSSLSPIPFSCSSSLSCPFSPSLPLLASHYILPPFPILPLK